MSSMKLKVVFFGNSQSTFSNRHFESLTASSCVIAAVIDTLPAKRDSTNPKADAQPFTERARKLKIPIYEPANSNEPQFVKKMQKLSPDLFIAVGYPNLLKSALLAVPKVLSANFHASLLPAYRGKHPVFWALRNAEQWAGLTVHVMDQKLDTGDILYQVRVRTRKYDSVTTLYSRIIDRSVSLVNKLLKDIASGKLKPKPQLKKNQCYCSSVSQGNFKLNWSLDAEQLRRWICTSPGRCFSDIAGQRVFFLDAHVESGLAGQEPGTVVRIGRTCCAIATAKQALRLCNVKSETTYQKFMARLCRDISINKGDCIR